MLPSGRFERPQSAESFAPADTPKPPATSDAAQPALLQEVLKQTLATMGAAEHVALEELEALQAVARRNIGQPLDEEIATELVQAVLCSPTHDSANSSSLWQTTARKVAQLMLEDPEAQQRLNRMWAGLGGASP